MKYLITSIWLCSQVLFLNAQRHCGTGVYWEEQLSRDPAMKLRYAHIDATGSLRSEIARRKYTTSVADLPVITIPVVVHVLYNTPEQNISDAQIQSQLDVLNRDFRKQNEDLSKIPSVFASFAADCGIRFALAKSDPQGKATAGIIRKKTNQTSWQQDDKMKFAASGGSEPWDSRYYLNIWVCNLSEGLLGYSTFPGAVPEKDGVVIRTDVFGTIGKNGTVYNKGRTTTHEIGHWLNLKHLWGDADCGDDGVDDTPPQKTYNSGCPSFPRISSNSCNPAPSGDMFMNFMDFSDDACLQMFTEGQKQKMWRLFDEDGARKTLLYSPGLNDPRNPGESPTETSTRLTVFPNPATSVITLNINNDNPAVDYIYTVYDLWGKPVLQGQNAGNTLSVKTLSKGIYFLRLLNGKETRVTKFIKE
ncbi:MAG: T9SS type A sorting domain-containing protein [Chitinophagaceae bacterium]|nr:T9SS type A sorting domain-containing protein [Chitinophagaceae bacterium]